MTPQAQSAAAAWAAPALGHIRLEHADGHGRVRSERPQWADRWMRGCPVDAAPRRIAILYALCGGAHALCAELAVQAILSGAPQRPNPEQAARLALTTAREHLIWALHSLSPAAAVDAAPPGGSGEGGSRRASEAAADALRLQQAPVWRTGSPRVNLEALGPWWCAHLSGSPESLQAASAARDWTAVEGLLAAAPAGAPRRWIRDWPRWLEAEALERSTQPAAQDGHTDAFGCATPSHGWKPTARFGLSHSLGLPIEVGLGGREMQLPEGLRELAQAMIRPGFCAQPTLRDRVPETGAWARAAQGPALEPPSLRQRWLARWLEPWHLAQPGGDEILAAGAVPLDADTAIAWVEMGRGLLLHRVQLDPPRAAAGGAVRCVAAWQVLAPTEWNFHPQGVLGRLLRASAADIASAPIDCWLTVLDPCVPVQRAPIRDVAGPQDMASDCPAASTGLPRPLPTPASASAGPVSPRPAQHNARSAHA